MSNPFVYGVIVSDENFADRKNELSSFVADLKAKTNLIIFSPRRYGKSSLILRVLEELKKKDIICVYIDLLPATNIERFVEIFTNAIASARSSWYTEIVNLVKELIPPIKITVRPEGTEDIRGGMEIEISKSKKDIMNILKKLYDLPEEVAKKKKKKLVVVFDEFQEIKNLDGDEIERELRTKIQHHKSVSYVFMGSQKHLLNEIFNDTNKPLYNVGKLINLDRIPESEFQDFIIEKFKKTKITISKQICNKILKITGCHPYYTQQICHEVWNICKSQKGNKVIGNYVVDALDQLMKNQNHAYTSIWESIKGSQRSLIMAMAISDTAKIFSSDFLKKYNLGSVATIQTAAKLLEKKSIIEKQGGNYDIVDGFFKEWIKRMRNP